MYIYYFSILFLLFKELENTSTEEIETTTERNEAKSSHIPVMLAKQTAKKDDDHVKNDRPSSTEPLPVAQKKGKFMKDTNANINDLTLPGSADVWTLVGMKENPAHREEVVNSTTNSETSESLENKEEVVGTKNLSDWSKIMKEVYGLNETVSSAEVSKNNSIEGPPLTTTTKPTGTITEGMC